MKREDLPLVTPDRFKKFGPSWLLTEDGRERFERVAALRDEWNALDVIDLEDVSARDRLWAVLRKEFLPPMLLHEFACRCAEWALSRVENPDARSVEAPCVKRQWVAGDVTDETLLDASHRGCDVWKKENLEWRKAWAARIAACDAEQEFLGTSNLYFIEIITAGVAVNAASSAAWCAEPDAEDAARGAAFTDVRAYRLKDVYFSDEAIFEENCPELAVYGFRYREEV